MTTTPDDYVKPLIGLALMRQAEISEGTYAVYTETLNKQNVELEDLQQACYTIGLEQRAEFQPAFPAVGDLLTACKVAKAAREQQERNAKLLPMPKTSDEPTFFCPDCEDEPYGWRTFQCHGVGELAVPPKGVTLPVRACARMKPHYAHTYVDKCSCYGMNPVSAKHRERIQAAQQKRAERSSSRRY